MVAGVDEAGRGPLAGPVVASACVLPPGLLIEGIRDSKALVYKKREKLYNLLSSHSDITYGVGVVNHQRIDEINILVASLEAMSIAIEQLPLRPDFLLIDGNQAPRTNIPTQTVIKGDTLLQNIAAASIIAKHIRDQIMIGYHSKWPQYGFDRHKGYPTLAHVRAIKEHGVCPIHRRSFAPVRSAIKNSVF